MTLSVVCQAQPLTKRFVVEVEQKTGSQNLNFSIKPDQHTLSGTFSDIAHTNGYAESSLTSDEKQVRLNGCELKKTIIESMSWPWLYANHLLVGYELILTSKNTPLSSTTYSWLPVEVIFAVGWLLKSYWNIYSSSFNPIELKELCRDHPLAAIIMTPGSGNDQQQHPPSEPSGQQAQEATVGPTGASNSFLHSDSAGGSGGSQQQHQHTLGLDCFVSPCHGACQFRPSSNSSGPNEWQMDSMAHTPDPRDTVETPEADLCPICLSHFHGRNPAPVIVKAHCCGKHFDLDCISKSFLKQPIGSRQCAMCRQDPMPMLNKNTGEYHPDTFFPKQAFFDACILGDWDQVAKSLAEGVNVNAVKDQDYTALMLASLNGHRAIIELLFNYGANLYAVNDDGITALHFAAGHHYVDNLKLLIEAGADINARARDGFTPLHCAAWSGNTNCMKTLIEGKADLNAALSNGAIPLHIAAMRGHTNCVKVLIEAGADLNTTLPDGATPLSIAAEKGNTECVKALTEAGAR
ncbi:ankyrin repeat domain-containing protein [Endozoicomonas sp. ISHI1]|uniref:ankyrin repeat domain-containing protein n=1 Tax=Endozoicomonas sp. ISHI1 TaxID=2825882 RepID=UPI002148C75F|nr:ankyrin repeat domain-containing protein [Endozoicomonas sp. ISHI1]